MMRTKFKDLDVIPCLNCQETALYRHEDNSIRCEHCHEWWFPEEEYKLQEHAQSVVFAKN